ncbi:MAG: hypothetical protein ABFC84_06010 [Veillonellales bacterium]
MRNYHVCFRLRDQALRKALAAGTALFWRLPGSFIVETSGSILTGGRNDGI